MLRVWLNPKDQERLASVKKSRKLKTDSETVRHMLLELALTRAPRKVGRRVPNLRPGKMF